MNFTEHRITLDIHKTASPVSVSVKKGDTGRKLLIQLTERGYPYHISEDCYAVFTGKKPDGKVVFNECSIEDCVIAYHFTEQTVAVAGLMECEIILYGSGGQQLTSACFSIIVEETIYDTETEIESTNEYNALADLIGKTQKLFSYGPVAQAVVRDTDGTLISVTDASNQALQGLRIFGKSTQAGTPTPDSPAEIVNVGAADGEIVLLIAGKNLFANSEMHAVDATGTEVNNGAARRTPYIPVRPGQKLTFSKSEVLPADSQPNGMLRMYDKNRKYVSSITALGYAELEKVVTIPSNIYFVRFVQYGFTYVDGLEVQIEIATEATEYDGNKGQVLAIATPDGLRGLPVTSGGNYTDADGQEWICDEVDLARGVYIQRIEKAVLAGDSADAYTLNSVYGDAIRFDVKGVRTYARSDIILCTHLPAGSVGTNNVEICNIHGIIGYPIIQILSSRLESADASGLQKYLAENPITIFYVLDNPIETKLTDAQIAAYAALRPYKPSTTIYTGAGAYMAAAYVADTKTYIDRGASGSAASIGEVTLLAADWKGDASPYAQVVEIRGVTECSQVDLTPSVEQLSIFYNKDLAFVTENEDGVVTVYAIGQKPENDYTIQVTITEVYV